LKSNGNIRKENEGKSSVKKLAQMKINAKLRRAKPTLLPAKLLAAPVYVSSDCGGLGVDIDAVTKVLEISV
jgi:hypothetical protein